MNKAAAPVAVAGAAFALLAWYVLRFHYPIPIEEHFQVLDLRDKWLAGTYRFRDGNGIYGGNWGLFGLNLSVMLALTTRWSLDAEAALVVGILALTGAAWAWAVCRLTPDSARRAWLAALGAWLLFSLNQSVNLLWTWQLYLFLHNLGVVLCLATLTVPRYRLRHLAVALAGALLAVYDVTTGLALLPVYALGLWLRPDARRWLWVWVPAALAMGLHTYGALHAQLNTEYAGSRIGIALTVENMALLLRYVLLYLGVPLAGGVLMLGTLAGALALGYCLLVNMRLLRHWQHWLLPAALMNTAALGGLIVAVGRHGVGLERIFLGHYYSFANLFWLGACMALLQERRWPSCRRAALVLIILLHTLTTCYVVVTHRPEIIALAQAGAALKREGPQADVGSIPAFVGPRGEEAAPEAYFARMQRQRLGIFRE